MIAGYRAELDREKLGLGLTVFVELKVDRPLRAQRAAAITDRSAPRPR